MKATQRLLAATALLWSTGVLVPDALQAQFGRNKVQYEPREFRIIETDHFDIYFYEEERQAAVDAARMAERIYGRLSRILSHDFQERKPIILYASQTDFQQTNVLGGHIDESTGGVTESLKDRVLLPLTGSYREFEHVLGHELVHSFQFDILKRSAVEQSASPFAFVPSLWFMEGMAEYLSVGRIDAKTVAWLRDAALDGYLRTIGEMDRFNDFLSYRFGQSLWNYIGKKWGDETIGLLLKRAASLGTERAFTRTLGASLEELSREWHEAVRATYLPQIIQADAVDRVARRVTDHVFPLGREKSPDYIAPALSPDGAQLAYLSDRGHDLYGFYDLYIADARTGKPTRTIARAARGSGFESLRYLTSSAEFSPDGDRIAFVAKSGGRDAIYIADVHTGRIERRWIPDLNGLQGPSWAPDGTRIVFTGLLGGLSNLYVWDLRSNRIQTLTSDRYARLHPAWSPDGRTIAFSTDESEGTDFDSLVFDELRIGLYDVETAEIRLLEETSAGTNINPVWSPDGKTLAFLSTRTGVFNVFLFDVDRGRVLQLTDVLTGAMGQGALLTSPGLSWARNADRLAFSYFEEAGFNIYTVDAPRRKAVPASKTREARTAVSQIGRPRLVEGRHRVTGTASRAEEPPASFYLTDEGFRRSDFGPDALQVDDPLRQAQANLSITSLLDSVRLALPDTAALAFRDYRVSLTPDVVGRPTIGAQVGGFFGGGVYGGSFITLTDMLGNHNMLIAGDIQGSFENARFFTSYTYLKNRLNFGVSFQQVPFYRFLGTQFGEIPTRPGEIGEFNLFERDQFRSVSVDAQYPLSSFARFDFGLAASSIERDLVFQGISRTTLEGFSITLDGPTRAFFKPYVGYVYDNSLPGFTGPIAGRRLRLTAAPSLGDLNMADLIVDVRNYLRLPAALGFAQRLLSFSRFSLTASKDAEDFELAWGGPYYLRGYDINSYGPLECARSQEQSEFGAFCPAQQELIGTSVLLLNSELRVPVLNPLKDSWLPLNFPPIDGALFFDVGLAFTPGRTQLVWKRQPGQDIVLYRQPLTSYGLGLRMNLFFAILRLDYTVAPARGRGIGQGIWSVSFGEMF